MGIHRGGGPGGLELRNGGCRGQWGPDSCMGPRCSALTHSPQIVPGAFPALQTPTAASGLRFCMEPHGVTLSWGEPRPPGLSLLMGLQLNPGVPTSLWLCPTPELPFSPSRALQIPTARSGTSRIAPSTEFLRSAVPALHPTSLLLLSPCCTSTSLSFLQCWGLASEFPPSIFQAPLYCNPPKALL